MTDEERKTHEKFMRRCLQLARCGCGTTSPNPMVGAVVVHDGLIIGEGYHHHQGGPHAEVRAIASVRQPGLLRESTIYVSLEPCAHYGKTPPCADLIVSKGIPRVVVGCGDPFAKVNGLGIKKLRDAGVDVTVGILEKECQELNRAFFTTQSLGRPYVLLKWAQSADGFIDRQRDEAAPGDEAPVTFSTPTTLALSHKLRAEMDAILVGGRTDILDRPSLTTRYWAGSNPQRFVLHRDVDCEAFLRSLPAMGIQSIIVEGGARTHQRFIDAGLWDAARVEVSPVLLGEGVRCATLPTNAVVTSETKVDGNAVFIIKYNNKG